MFNSVCHTIRELKFSLRVLVFSVLNVGELICGFKNLEETMHVQVDIFLKTPLLICLNFFPNVFSKINSFQTRGAAYLRVRLICEHFGSFVAW